MLILYLVRMLQSRNIHKDDKQFYGHSPDRGHGLEEILSQAKRFVFSRVCRGFIFMKPNDFMNRLIRQIVMSHNFSYV